MTIPAAEREFVLFARGDRREEMLASFRTGLRQYINPDTALPFTETEIATATASGSRYWLEADAIDLVLAAEQQRALWLADQVRPDRAGTSWLRGYHGGLWGERPLPATGGSGPVNAQATPGTVWVGSTVVPDPTAHVATDPKGQRFQVRKTAVTLGNGIAPLSVVGIDTGEATDLEPDTELTWVKAPLSAQPKAVVTDKFTGGTNDETDAEFAKRLMARIRYKQAAGNDSHFRSWARDASNAVEDAFVYSCAFHAGSVLVCIVQKRAGVKGPTARIASAAIQDAVRAYLVPRLSPVVPARAHVVVVTAVPEPCDMMLGLAMARGLSSGWADVMPFPNRINAPCTVALVQTQQDFQIHADDPKLPNGVNAPRMMVWNADTSQFESLNVSKVTEFGGNVFRVELSAPPSFGVAVGDVVCPDTARRDAIADAAQEYFDALGPGEVIDLSNDERAHRAYRFPEPHEDAPYRAGSGITSRMTDALGVSLADCELLSASVSMPSIPATPILGPRMIVPGALGVYPT